MTGDWTVVRHPLRRTLADASVDELLALLARPFPYTLRPTMGAGAALCFLSLAVVLVKTIPVALAAICLVLLGHTPLSPNMFAAVSDTFPGSAVARVTGLTGIASGLSGMLFPLFTGVVVDRISYTPVFAMASLMPAAALLVLILLAGRFEQVTLRQAS